MRANSDTVQPRASAWSSSQSIIASSRVIDLLRFRGLRFLVAPSLMATTVSYTPTGRNTLYSHVAKDILANTDNSGQT